MFVHSWFDLLNHSTIKPEMSPLEQSIFVLYKSAESRAFMFFLAGTMLAKTSLKDAFLTAQSAENEAHHHEFTNPCVQPESHQLCPREAR
jgi:hypothetical protein